MKTPMGQNFEGTLGQCRASSEIVKSKEIPRRHKSYL